MSMLKLKNPFKGMNEEEWEKYAHNLEPHFTQEPYYEIVPWSQIKARIEDSAKDAGFDLILRTTNNKAYCPDTNNLDWIQKTKWIFGYKNKRIIIHITYTEQIMSGEWVNFVENQTYMELPKHEIDVTKEYEEFEESYDVTSSSNHRFMYEQVSHRDGRCFATVFRQPTPPDGYLSNGGFVGPGTTHFHYFNVASKNLHPYYKELRKTYNHPGWTNTLERDITPTFFKEWLEKNPIVSGKASDILLWSFSDTFTFPGQPHCLSLLMDYLFLEKLMQSSIADYVLEPWSRECTWEVSEMFWRQNGMTEKSCSVLEGRVKDYWYPVFDRKSSSIPVTEFEELRFTPKLKKLIDEKFAQIVVM